MFMDKFKMAGRGRGRGRGAIVVENRPGKAADGPSPPKVQSEASKEPIAPSPVNKFNELCGEFKGLKVTSNDALLSDLATKAKDLSKSDEHYIKIIDILYQKVFQDNECAAKIAQLGNLLSSLDDVGGKFRSCLLKRAQEHYKNRDKLKKDSASEWTGLLCFLCEIFKVLRISGSPLKPLTGPIYKLLGEVLQKLDDSEHIDCFYVQLKNIGKMLSDLDKQKMDDLVSKLRDSILSAQCTPETRCLLTELLELQASSWTLSPEVERFYSDALADILAAQG